MATPVSANETWCFDVFEVDTRRVELRRDGKPVKLREQLFLILVYLVEHAGEIVTREELCRVLWPADTFVDFDHSLNMAVMKLREALGDSIETPIYIETIPKRGYRFIAPVTAAGETRNGLAFPNGHTASVLIDGTNDPQHIAPTASEAPIHPLRFGRTAAALGLFLVTAAVLATAVWYLRRPLPPPRITDYLQITNDGRKKTIAGTDGSRLYLNFQDPRAISQMAVSGGQTEQIPIDLPNPMVRVSDVSADGTKLLILEAKSGDWEFARLWVVGIVGRPARYLADAQDAVFSPDGKSVIYAYEGNVSQIPSDGGKPRLLAPLNDQAGNWREIWDLSWSPDRSKLRFSGEGKLWEMSSDGSNLHQLLPGWHTSSFKCCGRWTANGEFFVFLSAGAYENRISLPESQLWALDERKGLRRPLAQPIQITSGPTRWATPIPSRNGQKIFARGTILRGQLVRFDRQSKQFQPFLGGISAEGVDFSKDGKSVTYVSYPEGILWRANRDGTGLVQLTEPPFYPKRPRWSPDGTQILFASPRPNGFDAMYVVPSQGGTPQSLLSEDNLPETNGSWSPDGKKVAYASDNQVSDMCLVFHVHVLDLASHTVMTLPNSLGVYSPYWSPDGRYIAAIRMPDRDLVIFDLKSQRWTTLQKGGAALGIAGWSKDGSSIFYRLYAGDQGLYRTGIKGGKAERITALNGFHDAGSFFHGLDPDDAPLLLKDAGNDEIYALTLESK